MEESDDLNSFRYIVIGGGITGVSVVEKLRSLDETGTILMITESDVVQAASKVNRITMNLDDFIIVEKTFETFKDIDQKLAVVKDRVIKMDSENHLLITQKGKSYQYKFLCICSGATPHLISFKQTDGYDFADHILGIRDTASVSKITKALSQSKRVMVVGNGGIATEFVFEAKNVDIIWVVKDSSIAAPYFDNGAACFLLSSNQFSESCQHTKPGTSQNHPVISKRLRYSTDGKLEAEEGELGSALGPDWHNAFSLLGLAGGKTVDVQYSSEVRRLFNPLTHYELILSEFGEEEANESTKWRTYVELTNEKRFGVDLILSATGVTPNANWFPGFKRDEQGIYVNDWMHTSIPDVFAAGDVCFPYWTKQRHWFQMRLWSQARNMGFCAGSSMYAAAEKDNCDNLRARRTPLHEEFLNTKLIPEDARNEMFGGFDIFTHVTKFFGFKVILLGLYNGQGISKQDQRIELRYTPNEEYIKVIISDDRVQGAVLIGDTGLEETFENMILCQIDISKLGTGHLLDPAIDLEDYFD